MKISKVIDNNYKNYLKLYNELNKTAHTSILQIKQVKNPIKSFSCFHMNKYWDFFEPPPNDFYDDKPYLFVDYLYTNIKGMGTCELKRVVQKSYEDKNCEGRVVLCAQKTNFRQGHPLGFYYKLGFRAVNQNINYHCERWLNNGGLKSAAPFACSSGINILKCSSNPKILMYLPKENIQTCLNYPENIGLYIVI